MSHGKVSQLAVLHSYVVGAPPGLLQSGAMPPCSLQHSARASTASHNKSVNTDRVTAGFARLRASGYLQRYAAWKEQSV
jgi:hypothetical protein